MGASLTIPGGSEVFSFATASTDQGMVLEKAMRDEEPLRTPGVDGTRWRTNSLQHSRFTVTTVTACASFADAVRTAITYRGAKGRICTFRTDAGGGNYQIRVHVEDVAPRPGAGQVTGAAASAGNLAHIITTWVLVPLAFSDADTVSG